MTILKSLLSTVWSKPCFLLSEWFKRHLFFPHFAVWPYGCIPSPTDALNPPLLFFLHMLCPSLFLSFCSPCLTASSLRQGHRCLVHRISPGPSRIPGTKQAITKILWNVALKKGKTSYPVLCGLNSSFLPQNSTDHFLSPLPSQILNQIENINRALRVYQFLDKACYTPHHFSILLL